jgi:purine-nucleoside phosphorylase
VICFQGRLHYYEGYTMQQVVLPIRIMQLLHINKVWITNASGGLNPAYNKGDIMMISDHINLQNENPLRGENIDKLGVRFTDMLHTYQPEWIKKAVEIATKKRIVLHDGVYVAVAGPNLETPAEYKMLRLLGADVVGMSTVPEVLAAKHGGMQIAAFSIITDVCFPIERLQAVTINDIIKVANDAQPFLIEILKELIHEV